MITVGRQNVPGMPDSNWTYGGIRFHVPLPRRGRGVRRRRARSGKCFHEFGEVRAPLLQRLALQFLSVAFGGNGTGCNPDLRKDSLPLLMFPRGTKTASPR